MKIINAWSLTKDSSIGPAGSIVLIYKDKDGKRVLKPEPFDWYFFCDKAKGVEMLLQNMIDANRIKSYQVGKDYIKINMDKKYYDTAEVKAVVKYLQEEKKIQTYEADLGPAKRYILEKKLEIEDFENINLMYFDIETDDSHGPLERTFKNGKTQIKAKDRILSIACVDRKGNEHYFTHADEKTLLTEFLKFVKGVDMLVGWNSKEFDLPYLRDRMKTHKLNGGYLWNILHEDMMRRFQYFYMKDPEARQGLTSYSLEFVSQYFLKEGKIKDGMKVKKLFDEYPEKLKAYNLNDCHLLRKLEDAKGLIRLTYSMSQTCKCTAQDWSMIKNIDNFLLASSGPRGIHFKTNESFLNQKEDNEDVFLGAFVLDPIPGKYKNVYDLDFKSLYPNIIRTFNISLETYEESKDTVLLGSRLHTPGVEIDGIIRGLAYYKPEQGVIPREITILLADREKIRKEQKNFDKSTQEWRDLNVKQLVIKELANSIYGVLGNQWFRGFNINMAESITATGQYLIKHLAEILPKKKWNVFYGDTDSIFLTLPEGEKIEDVLEWINQYLDKHLKEKFGVKECTIQMALDKKLDNFIIETKKKYVGQVGDKIHYSGMECVKRDTIPTAALYQQQLIKMIFDNMSANDIRIWIGNRKESNDKIKNLKEISIYKKIGKSDYVAKEGKKYTPPVHVRIAQRLKEESKGDTDLTAPGTIIPFIVTSSEEGINGIHISEFKGEWDKKYYWDNLVYPPLDRLLKCVFPEEDWDQFYFPVIKKVRKKKILQTEEVVL